ncbi:hypothetical protein QL285_080840 [Trifolium repens]|nr:hypothetical protein QL285_080840 [Trifolium repens]
MGEEDWELKLEEVYKPVMESAPPLKCLVIFDEEMNSGRIFEVECSTQDFVEFVFGWGCQYLNGFIIFGSVTRSGRISEVVVLKLFFCRREMGFCMQSFLLGSLIKSRALFQVNRLFGARTRLELTIGAELGLYFSWGVIIGIRAGYYGLEMMWPLKFQRQDRSEDAIEDQSLKEILISEYWNSGRWCHRNER